MASCEINTCSSVDFPEPVLPATSTCCEVPCPNSRYCLPVAPNRPTGTRSPLALSELHQESRGGMIHSNGTSTLLERTASSPTCCKSAVQRAGGGECSSAGGNMPKASSSQTKGSFRQSTMVQTCSSSAVLNPCGAGCFVSTTPQL